MVDNLASALPAVAQSLSAQSSSSFHTVKVAAFMICGMNFSFKNIIHLMLRKRVCILLKINCHASYAF